MIKWLKTPRVYYITPLEIITRVGAIIALILILGILNNNDQLAKEEAYNKEIARYKLPMDCKFNDGAFPHVWKDACQFDGERVAIR